MLNTAAIYARYSTDKQDARSIEDQVRRCREFAKRTDVQVVREFSDEAISGSHMRRPQLQALLAEARAKRPPFRVVLVDDLSRLSRDLGQTWRVIFEELAACDVVVIDCTTSMRSDAPGARLVFGATGLVNDTFLQLVKTETHRGLEGRALAGFWTGGKVYGYATRLEENPPDPDHPRAVPVVDEAEAAIVRRIFELFIEGAGLKSIAHTLNRDGIRAPHDDGKGHKGLRGWTHGTIRNVLRNERYIGRWAWNTTKCLRDPTTGRRRRIARARSEWVVRELPALAIIDALTWRRTESQLRRRTEGGGRPPGTGRAVYLVSGLLRCGACGGGMSIIGGRTLKNGTRCVTFGCTTYYTRGEAICGNSLTIAEKRITSALLESLRELFTSPEVIQRLTANIAAKIEKLAKAAKTKVTASTIADVEGRIRQLTETLARMPASEALLQKLADEERRLAELKAAKRSSAPTKTLKAPTEDQVRGLLSDLVGTFEADPVAGRDALADIMSPLILSPKTAPRGYECRADFRFPNSLGPSSGTEESKKSSSGGRI